MPFVISRASVEWSDRFAIVNTDAGTPQLCVLGSKDAAQCQLRKLNIEAFAGVDLALYCRDLNSLSNFKDTASARASLPFLKGDELSVPSAATTQQLERVFNAFHKLRFYYLTDVPVAYQTYLSTLPYD